MASGWKLQHFEELGRRSIFDGVSFRFVAGERVSIAECWFTKGTVLPSLTQASHNHESEEILYMIRGKMRVRLGADLNDEVIVGAGDALVIPSNMHHGGEVMEDSYGIVVYAPIRGDFDAAKTVAAE